MFKHKFGFKFRTRTLRPYAAEIIDIVWVVPFIFLQFLLSFQMVSLTCMPFFKLDNLPTK